MPMEPMQIQPLELADFSGGLTENWFDSGPTRYAAANNFLISVDRKLQMRPGTIPFDFVNYLLPGQPRRIDALFTYINESKLLVNQGRTISVLPDNYTGTQVWTPVTGPSGNEAIGAGQIYAQTVMGEFQHQMYFVNDSQPIPARIYRDGSNNYQARTAGLPRLFNQPTYTTSALLNLAITNANAIQAAMISHFNDQNNTQNPGWTGGTFQHIWTDKYSLSYFSSQTFINNVDPQYPGPQPVPTPAPAATDLPSLLALVGALGNAYTNHVINALFDYHFQLSTPSPAPPFAGFGTVRQAGPNVPLTQLLAPSTLPQACALLDEIYQKFYWHMFAVNLHGGPFNDVTIMNKYDYTGSIQKIGATGFSTVLNAFTPATPTITANNQDFYDYVNGLQGMWNVHAGGANGSQASTNPVPGLTFPFGTGLGVQDRNLHTQPDVQNFCTLPVSTTLDQAFLKIFWLRNLYNQQHVFDGNNMTTVGILFSGSALSNSITVTDLLGANITLPTNIYIYVPEFGGQFDASTGFQNVAAVVSSGSGTAVLDRNLLNNLTNEPAFYTPGGSLFHLNFVNGTPTPTTTAYFPNSGEFLTSANSSVGTDLVSWNSFAQEFMYCLFTHMSDATLHKNSNAPQNDVSTLGGGFSPGITNWYIPTVASIAWAFTYYTTWTVEPNGIQYTLEGNPVFSASVEMVEPLYVGFVPPTPVTAQAFNITFNSIRASQATPITLIPAIINDNSTNYDTANIQVRIYRTTNGGSTFFLDQTIANGVTSFQDVQNSTVAPPNYTLLNLNQVLYTSGGVVGNDQPPPAKCLHILNGTAIYGNIIQAGQYLPNTLSQALPGNPDSAPATFTDTLEDAIVAISSTRSNFITLCSNSVYRLSGAFNSLGQGQIVHERISDTTGCLSAHSVVRTEIGVFFAGNDGFYYTDGFQLIKISIDLNGIYLSSTQTQAQRNRIYGAYDKSTRRIWWSIQSNPTDTDCDMNFIFYLDYGIKPSGVYTTASNDGKLVPIASNVANSPSVGNPLNYNYWQPSSVVFYQGQLVRGDSRGLLFKTDPNSTTDPKVDLTIAAYTFSSGVPTQNWNTVPMPFNFKTTAMDFGTRYKRKYATRMNFLGQNQGNAQIQMNSISDDGRVVGSMAPINYTLNPLWGDARVTWGATSSPNYNWYYGGSADFWRRFPSTTLRANLRQIQITNAFMGIYRVEDFPPGTSISTNGATKVVTLNSPSAPAGFYGTINWPLDVVDYFLATSNDGYVQTWQISAVSGATITVLDTAGTLGTQANVGFVIRGYKKNSSVEISGLVIRFSMFGDKTSYWQSNADSGENN